MDQDALEGEVDGQEQRWALGGTPASAGPNLNEVAAAASNWVGRYPSGCRTELT